MPLLTIGHLDVRVGKWVELVTMRFCAQTQSLRRQAGGDGYDWTPFSGFFSDFFAVGGWSSRLGDFTGDLPLDTVTWGSFILAWVWCSTPAQSDETQTT